MMKKWIAFLLAAFLLAGQCTAFADDSGTASPAIPLDHLTVGSTTAMKGDFFTEMWGNATSDADVRALLHGYNLIRWNGEDGMFTTDPMVVTGVVVTENTAKDKIYTLVLNKNLRYSDGSKITAWDYAFSYLLLMSPELEGAGATPLHRDYLLGSEDFRTGKTPYLAGVHVTSDDSLSITLSHDYLPFFYEMGLLSCEPYPIRVIAPGVAVKDDGSGVYLTNEDTNLRQPVFTAELLNRTLNDPLTGYRTHPSVVSGPYTLAGFDGTTAEFVVNPYYAGDEDGFLPQIPSLTFTLADNTTMIADLQSGRFGLLNKVTNAEAVSLGLSQVQSQQIRMANYPRSGLSYISFACERPAVSTPGVRQAIAWCLDRDAVTADYTGSFGLRADGYYGIGQWMYGLVYGTIAPPVDPPADPNDPAAVSAYEKELKAWDDLTLDNLTRYDLDLAAANSILEREGWWRNPDGLREKYVNGQRVILDLTMAIAEGNRIKSAFEKYLVPNLAEVGIRLTLVDVSSADLAKMAYEEESRSVDMFYQASNFDIIFDPAVYFAVENGKPGAWSFTNQTDLELYTRALAMRETEPGKVLEYMQKWVSFQERFNAQLPMLPIYSNVYFDFFTAYLHNYTIAQNTTWSRAIIGAYLSEDEDLLVLDDQAEASAANGSVVIDDF